MCTCYCIHYSVYNKNKLKKKVPHLGHFGPQSSQDGSFLAKHLERGEFGVLRGRARLLAGPQLHGAAPGAVLRQVLVHTVLVQARVVILICNMCMSISS